MSERPRRSSRSGGRLSDPRVRGAAGVTALFLVVQLLALGVAPRLAVTGVSYGEGGDALVPLVLGLIVGTLLSLAVVRFGTSERVVRGLMLVSLGTAQWFAFVAFLGPVAGVVAATVGTVLAWRVPRPSVRNAAAVIGVAGGAGLFGASLAPVYAAAALVVAAGYDAYAVYGSGVMTDIADAGARLRVPSMFVVPTDDEYDDSRLRVGGSGAPAATVLGAGDALFPAMLSASLAVHAVGPAVALGDTSVSGAAVASVVGSLVGLVALQVFVHRRAGVHAGLPFVNVGALVGWVGWLLVRGI